MTVRTSPVRVALVDDYDVVVIGLAHLFDAYRDRIVVAELDDLCAPLPLQAPPA